jgi:flavin reductase (DIM6/NTAB) family NADH-FMN oxidoreductase RutF
MKMTKKALGPQPLLWAHPTVLVGAVVDGKPDFAAVAWTGVAASKPPAVTIALQHHRYSLKGIRKNYTFSINIPSEDLVKETDYCGMISGSRTDKVADCNFKVFYGKLGNAPLIEQCPINLECEAVQLIDMGSHALVIGTVAEVYISEDCLTDGKPDVLKVKPFTFFPPHYRAIGVPVAATFKSGREIKEIV